jgi:protease IV
VDLTTIVSGDAKDFDSLYRPMTPEEVEYWKSMINEIYEGFVQVVADGRGLNPSAVREFADGRVFSGRQALELGLVDELGYQEDAIRVAAELGDISGQPRVISYQKFSPLASLLGQSLSFQGAGLPADWVKRILGPTLEYRWQP